MFLRESEQFDSPNLSFQYFPKSCYMNGRCQKQNYNASKLFVKIYFQNKSYSLIIATLACFMPLRN